MDREVVRVQRRRRGSWERGRPSGNHKNLVNLLDSNMVTLQQTRVVPVGIILASKAFVNLACGGISTRGLPNLLQALKEDSSKPRERGVLTSTQQSRIFQVPRHLIFSSSAPAEHSTYMLGKRWKRLILMMPSLCFFRCPSDLVHTRSLVIDSLLRSVSNHISVCVSVSVQ